MLTVEWMYDITALTETNMIQRRVIILPPQVKTNEHVTQLKRAFDKSFLQMIINPVIFIVFLFE